MTGWLGLIMEQEHCRLISLLTVFHGADGSSLPPQYNCSFFFWDVAPAHSGERASACFVDQVPTRFFFFLVHHSHNTLMWVCQFQAFSHHVRVSIHCEFHDCLWQWHNKSFNTVQTVRARGEQKRGRQTRPREKQNNGEELSAHQRQGATRRAESAAVAIYFLRLAFLPEGAGGALSCDSAAAAAAALAWAAFWRLRVFSLSSNSASYSLWRRDSLYLYHVSRCLRLEGRRAGETKKKNTKERSQRYYGCAVAEGF